MSDSEAERPKTIQVSERCYVRQEVDNIGWVTDDDGVIVVDALEQPQLKDEVFELIRDTTGGQAVHTLINTHTHYDHVALNDAFRESFGARVVNCVRVDIPESGLELGNGSGHALVVPMPGCHTQEDLVVWFADQRVLFVGDIFGWGLIPWDRPLDRATLDHILGTYDRLIALEPDTVVPGHGPLCGVGELQRWQSYVRSVVDQIKGMYRTGMSRRALPTDAVQPPEDMHEWWRFLKWKHEDTVRKIAQAVTRERL